MTKYIRIDNKLLQELFCKNKQRTQIRRKTKSNKNNENARKYINSDNVRLMNKMAMRCYWFFRVVSVVHLQENGIIV